MRVVFVLDTSGSMEGKESDMVGGVNTLLRKVDKKSETPTHVVIVTFSSQYHVFYDGPLTTDAPRMTLNDYRALGTTSLFDVLAQVLEKYVTDDNTTLFLATDGCDNSSREVKLKNVRRMIDEKREKLGTKFVFLGENEEAFRCGMDAMGSAMDCSSQCKDLGKGMSDECFLEQASQVMSSNKRRKMFDTQYSPDL